MFEVELMLLITLFRIIQFLKQCKCLKTKNKENVFCMYNRTFLTIKNEVMSFEGVWVELDNIILS